MADTAPQTTFTAEVPREMRLRLEDFVIQMEAASRSVGRGHYATAMAELRGAILVLDDLQKWADANG